MEKKAVDIKALAAYLKNVINPNEGKALYGPEIARAVREKGMTFVEPDYAKKLEHPFIKRFRKMLKIPNSAVSSVGELGLSNLISPRAVRAAATNDSTLKGAVNKIKDKGFIFNQGPSEPLHPSLAGVKTNNLSARDLAKLETIDTSKLEEAKQFKNIGETVRMSAIIKKLKSSNPARLHAALSKKYPQGYVAKLEQGAASLGTLGTADTQLAIPRLGFNLDQVNRKHLPNMIVQPDKQLASNNKFLDWAQKKFLKDYVNGSEKQEYRVHVVNGRVVPYATMNRGNLIQGTLENMLPFRTSKIRALEAHAQKTIDQVKNKSLRKGIYGFDMGVDLEGKPQLIETNPSASGGASGYLDQPRVMSAIHGAITGKLPAVILAKRLAYGAGGLAGVGAVANGLKGEQTENTKVAKSMELKQLLKAKKMSDQSDYVHKNELIRKMLIKNPEAFKVDSHLNRQYVGLTHIKSGFKIHAPKSIVPSSLMHPQIGA